MSNDYDVVVVGGGNAAFCAALSAREAGASVLVLEAAPEDEAGGNSRFTAGAMRVVYNGVEDLERLLADGQPPQALYLDLHGAMVAEHLDDGEGEFLGRVRRVVGDAMPVVASLDLHANVTAAMVALADVLVAYRTYPHVDRRQTGERAARVMDSLLTGVRKPDKAFRQIPFLIPLTWQCTMVEPMASVYGALGEVEGGDVLSASVLAGFPLTDIPDCGPSVVAYGAGAEAVEGAVDRVLEKGYRTPDIMEEGMKVVGTVEMGSAIANEINLS